MRTAITIGNFDGVHAGHRALLDRARAHAGPDGRVIALAFEPHALTVIRPSAAPASIESWSVREARLLVAGADRVERLAPTPELLGMNPEGFIDWLIERHRPTHIVEGSDFRFGSKRAGDAELLTTLGKARGIEVEIVPPVVVALTDQSEVVASSSLVRWLLGHGRVRDVAYVLGRPHELTGTVVAGDRIGRTIGFPTANIETDALRPGDGVYAGLAGLPDGSEAIAAIHIGGRPAINDDRPRLEAHLLDPEGGPWNPPESMPETGWACTLRLVGRVRDVIKLDGLDALKAQIARDCARAREMTTPLLRTPQTASHTTPENA